MAAKKAKKRTKNRHDYTINEKVNIIRRAEESISNGDSKLKVAEDLGIPRPTLIRLLKERDQIMDVADQGIPRARKRLRTGVLGDAEDEIVQWTRRARSRNVPVTGDLLKKKAQKLAKNQGKLNFKASNGWMDRFKRRNSIRCRRIQGEAGAVDMEGYKDWRQRVLEEDLKRYPNKDIFNADEFPLYWKLMPNRTYALKNDPCTAGKICKERLTVLACTNMEGDEKRELLVIGKYRKPRCFKRQQIPVTYRANATAWMKNDLWEEWLIEWNAELAAEDRRILLYVDQLAPHKTSLNLSHIELKFLPAYTTAVSQPLDQGIIKTVKSYYKKHLLEIIVDHLDKGKELKFNLLHALRLLKKSWNEVKPSTIQNCFRHAGFVKESNSENEDEHPDSEDEWNDEDVALIRLWDELNQRDPNIEAELADFLEAEDELQEDESSDIEVSDDEEIENSDAETEEPIGVREGTIKLVDYEITSQEESSIEENVIPKNRRRLVFPESDEESESAGAESEEADEEMEEIIIRDSPLTARKPAKIQQIQDPRRPPTRRR